MFNFVVAADKNNQVNLFFSINESLIYFIKYYNYKSRFHLYCASPVSGFQRKFPDPTCRTGTANPPPRQTSVSRSLASSEQARSLCQPVGGSICEYNLFYYISWLMHPLPLAAFRTIFFFF